MKLYILRHAEAEPTAPTDAERALTPKGLKQARRIARFFKKQGIKPDLLLTSPMRRCVQTAEFVATETGVDLGEKDFLACGMKPATAIKMLGRWSEMDTVVLVGHEPDLSRLIDALMGWEKSNGLRIRKASLTCISFVEFAPGSGLLEFSMPSKFV